MRASSDAVAIQGRQNGMTDEQFDWDIADAWIEIPDFDVKPSDVNEKGFAYSIVGQSVTTEMAMHMVSFLRTARRLLRDDFKTIQEMHDSRDEAITALKGDLEKYAIEEGLLHWRNHINDRQRVALVYSNFTRELKRTYQSDADEKEKLEALASALHSLFIWKTEGPLAAEKAQSARNRINASKPRPKIGLNDEDDIVEEFKKLCALGHTDRHARGILLNHGDMGSQTKIHKKTRNVVVSDR